MKVLITSNSFSKFDETPRQKMLDLGWELIGNRYKHIMNEEEMMGEVNEVDAIILGSDTVSKKVLDKANDLQIISRYGVGIDNIDLETAKEKGIEVTVTANCNTEAVADYAIGLMLSTLRHICNVDSNLKKNTWKKETGLDLCNKTVGVFGLGAIGREVVKRLQGFNCKILGYDKYVDEDYCKNENITIKEPKEIFKEADIITLHMPGNVDGSYFISKRELDMMKSSMVIINTARASLIDEEAMICALKDKRIYGYGTDVFAEEPLVNKEFADLDNVVLSPHNAAVSVEAINKMSHKAVDNLIEYFKTK
ncbi:phosphoglycerate dehydrogenase [Breznakia pachnodae]|uniref:D-3-phosphoglycerate dehydrogenase n=1 Tax=Breznakia pachnodae TaxID=265178 RepID=A0ABU0E8I1_9FIRM|nr:phosphoglycerate dehydrogenase [Breznakia pachnodae]MDQ0363208.1 D-3-phosphoglycerate dehydrogenase [Breznakia pachnodae]